MQEKRLTKRLIAYWEQLRKEQPMPLWEQFNSAAFTDIWQHCCGWSVEAGKTGLNVYTYTYVGHAVKEALGGDDPTGQRFTGDLTHFPGARIVKRIDQTVKERFPLIDEGQFINPDNRLIKFRSCLLPFATKREGVVQVVMGLSWRAF